MSQQNPLPLTNLPHDLHSEDGSQRAISRSTHTGTVLDFDTSGDRALVKTEEGFQQLQSLTDLLAALRGGHLHIVEEASSRKLGGEEN